MTSFNFFQAKRCLVPVDGFYEWTKGEDRGNDPCLIHLSNRKPFSLSGLCSYNKTFDVVSSTILTMPAGWGSLLLHALARAFLPNDSPKGGDLLLSRPAQASQLMPRSEGIDPLPIWPHS
jgi:putative SOS response-associated peptidase YedK